MGQFHDDSQQSQPLEWFHFTQLLHMYFFLLPSVITPHISDVMGVIVFTSFVCPSVGLCPSVSLSRPNRQAHRLEFWHGGQVEGYLGQVNRSRSRVKVTRSKNVHWDVPLTWGPCLDWWTWWIWTCKRGNSGIRRGVFSKHMWFFFQ